MLERLKKAEEEAAILREQLKEIQQKTQATLVDVPATRKIDGADLKREVPWGDRKQNENWLNESDVAKSAVVDFVTGGGPSEAAATSGLTEEEQATVTRRVIVGGLLAAATIGLALVPDNKLFNFSKPSKPLFFFLVPLLRAQQTLRELETSIEEAEWAVVQNTVKGIKGNPTNVRENMDSASAFLEDAATYNKAKALQTEFLEFLDSVDYQNYFDSLEKAPAKGGKAEASAVKFSLEACKLSQAKLAAFVSLFDEDQVQAARTQLETRIPTETATAAEPNAPAATSAPAKPVAAQKAEEEEEKEKEKPAGVAASSNSAPAGDN